MAHLSATDKDYDYTVAWTDCLATRGSLGRSVITSGDFATVGELRYRDRGTPLAFKPSSLVGAPAVFPSGLLNARTVGLLNEAYFRKAPRHRGGEIQTIGKFFHPLDAITNWNRVYGACRVPPVPVRGPVRCLGRGGPIARKDQHAQGAVVRDRAQAVRRR